MARPCRYLCRKVLLAVLLSSGKFQRQQRPTTTYLCIIFRKHSTENAGTSFEPTFYIYDRPQCLLFPAATAPPPHTQHTSTSYENTTTLPSERRNSVAPTPPLDKHPNNLQHYAYAAVETTRFLKVPSQLLGVASLSLLATPPSTMYLGTTVSRRVTYALSFPHLLPIAGKCMLTPLRSVWEAVAGARGWIHTVDGMKGRRRAGLPRKHVLIQKKTPTISS